MENFKKNCFKWECDVQRLLNDVKYPRLVFRFLFVCFYTYLLRLFVLINKRPLVKKEETTIVL